MSPQDKSNKIKDALCQGFRDKTSKLADRKCYGYDRTDGALVINQEQSKVV